MPRRRSERKAWKARCDELFRRIIRTRDGWTCRRCGFQEAPPTNRIQTAHVISRGKDSIRCDEENAVALCDRCHCHFTFQDRNCIEWHAWVDEHVAPGRVAALYARQEMTTNVDWKLLSIALKARWDELRGE